MKYGGRIIPKGGIRDVGEPIYKTFNLPTHLSSYLQDFEPTYKTSSLLTIHKYGRKRDFRPTYKSLNLSTRQTTWNISESTSEVVKGAAFSNIKLDLRS